MDNLCKCPQWVCADYLIWALIKIKVVLDCLLFTEYHGVGGRVREKGGNKCWQCKGKTYEDLGLGVGGGGD